SFSGKNLSLWDVRNCHITDKPHYVVTFTIPGLSLESFDNYSNANIISLMKTAMAARTYILHHPDPVTGDVFLDWPRVTSDRYMFMSSAEYTMSRRLYDSSIPKWPLDARFSLGNVGNSSVSYVIELYVHNENTAPLWKCVTQSVSIDTATRKPSPLPDWFKDKYKGKGCMDKGFIIRGFDRPSLTYKHHISLHRSLINLRSLYVGISGPKVSSQHQSYVGISGPKVSSQHQSTLGKTIVFFFFTSSFTAVGVEGDIRFCFWLFWPPRP
ncbi:unnamed protein product, partial [Candidula unifasciata]